jgi:hypothetical protein
MWMHEIQLADGSKIHAYKHSVTRRYLHLAADGRAFDYRVDGRYCEVYLATAIVRAFSGADRLLPSDEHLQAVRAAVQAARLRAADPGEAVTTSEPSSSVPARGHAPAQGRDANRDLQ